MLRPPVVCVCVCVCVCVHKTVTAGTVSSLADESGGTGWIHCVCVCLFTCVCESADHRTVCRSSCWVKQECVLGQRSPICVLCYLTVTRRLHITMSNWSENTNLLLIYPWAFTLKALRMWNVWSGDFVIWGSIDEISQTKNNEHFSPLSNHFSWAWSSLTRTRFPVTSLKNPSLSLMATHMSMLSGFLISLERGGIV